MSPKACCRPVASPARPQYTVALYGYLRKTPAVLLGVSLADAVGERRTQNIPGTRDEYPNWRIPLCDDTGRPVLFEDLPRIDLLRAVCQAVSPQLASQSSARGRSASQPAGTVYVSLGCAIRLAISAGRLAAGSAAP